MIPQFTEKKEPVLKLRHNIVPIEDWFQPYYTGKVNFWPFWIPHITGYFNSDFIKFILYGSQDLGKTYMSLGGFLNRQLQEILSVENFNSLFHIAEDSIIQIAFITRGLTKGKRQGVQSLNSMIDGIPFYWENCPRTLL